MKKISIIIATLLLSACVVPVSIGNKAVAEPKDNNEVVNTVYAKNGKTMVALNYILHQRAGQFEMLTKTIIMPAIKRQDIEVFSFEALEKAWNNSKIKSERDKKEFLKGAEIAYETILTSFANGDNKKLRNLLTPDMATNFEQAIQERNKENIKSEFTFIGAVSYTHLTLPTKA